MDLTRQSNAIGQLKLTDKEMDIYWYDNNIPGQKAAAKR
jgi:hypothetical protein